MNVYREWELERAMRRQRRGLGAGPPRLLDRCANVWGPLDDKVKRRLRRFFERPSARTWDDIFPILISPGATIWQACIAVDPACPRSAPGGHYDKRTGKVRRPTLAEKWPRFPDPVTVARAIKYVADGGKGL